MNAASLYKSACIVLLACLQVVSGSYSVWADAAGLSHHRCEGSACLCCREMFKTAIEKINPQATAPACVIPEESKGACCQIILADKSEEANIETQVHPTPVVTKHQCCCHQPLPVQRSAEPTPVNFSAAYNQMLSSLVFSWNLPVMVVQVEAATEYAAPLNPHLGTGTLVDRQMLLLN
jgi:hypothetical protein